MAEADVISIKGLEELQRKAEQVLRDLAGPPMIQALRDATLYVERFAKMNAPVDTGRLRASITPEVRVTTTMLTGIIGSNVTYAPYQELGTRPHFVPAKYIGVWAERHGLGFRGVRVSGKAKKYLSRAIEEHRAEIENILSSAFSAVIEKK